MAKRSSKKRRVRSADGTQGSLPALSTLTELPSFDELSPSEGQRPTLGTASYLPPIMGQMIAGHVIRNLVQGA